MRTTLDIENDVLEAAREIARQQNAAVGKVISRLARAALSGQVGMSDTQAPGVAGFRPFAARGTIVTDETIDRLRDAEGV